MNRKVGTLAILAAITLFAVGDQVEARHRLFSRSNQNCNCCERVVDCGCHGQCGDPNCNCVDSTCQSNTSRKSVKGSQFWPFTDGEEPNPQPEPLPDPIPQPDVPTPDGPPSPDPAPLPPEPAPAPPNPVVIPTDNAELNTFVAGKLGGFSRANYDRNGVTIDVYQARGKQRISWEVDKCENWMTAFVQAFVSKSTTGSSNAGLILICHCPDDPTPPVDPEPLPLPTPIDPVPAPEPLPVPDLNEPVQKKLYKFGGCPLVAAEATCRAAGLWLVVVHDKTGEANRVIYGNVTPQKVTWKAAKKSKSQSK